MVREEAVVNLELLCVESMPNFETDPWIEVAAAIDQLAIIYKRTDM